MAKWTKGWSWTKGQLDSYPYGCGSSAEEGISCACV